MDLLQAIVLGIVQGLTEFLPISSSGHLRIVPAFLGWEDPGTAFTAVIQLGTMAAVVLYFRGDLLRIARAWLASLRDRDRRARPRRPHRLVPHPRHGPDLHLRARLLAIRSRPARATSTSSAATLIALGLLLLVAEKVSRRERDLETLTLRDAIVIGFAQALALIPGVSRSGATITAGLFLGFDRVAAARFSFLLSVPAVVLSGLYELRDVIDGSAEGAAGLAPTAVATLLAFISGYASIAFLLRFLTTHTTGVFVAYRVALGAVVLVLAGTHVIA